MSATDSNWQAFKERDVVLCPLLLISIAFSLDSVSDEGLTQHEIGPNLIFKVYKQQRVGFDSNKTVYFE